VFFQLLINGICKYIDDKQGAVPPVIAKLNACPAHGFAWVESFTREVGSAGFEMETDLFFHFRFEVWAVQRLVIQQGSLYPALYRL
jgi:hypothetical protein